MRVVEHDDIVRFFIDVALARFPWMERADLRGLEVEVRAAWGGKRPYIRRSMPPSRDNGDES